LNSDLNPHAKSTAALLDFMGEASPPRTGEAAFDEPTALIQQLLLELNPAPRFSRRVLGVWLE
jgi:hypothetical protein